MTGQQACLVLSDDSLLLWPAGAKAEPIVHTMRAGWWAAESGERLLEIRGVLARLALPHGSSITLVLMPPLAQTRVVTLPALPDRVLAQVIQRDVSRYVPTGRVRQAVAIGDVRRGAGGGRDVVMSSAAGDLVEDLSGEVMQATLHLRAIRPAAGPLAASMSGQGERTVTITQGALTTWWHTKGRDLVDVRSVPTARVGSLTPPTDRWEPVAAMTVAATHATHGVDEFVPAAMAAEHRRLARRVTLALATAAVVLVGLAAALAAAATDRDMQSVARDRARLRETVGRVMATRDSVLALARQRTAMDALTASRTRVTPVLGLVTAAVPPTAHLTSLRIIGDTVWMEGIATRALDVFEALQRAPGFDQIRAEAPIRQVLRPNDSPLEHFTLASRWRHP
jgi:hypothetical protein